MFEVLKKEREKRKKWDRDRLKMSTAWRERERERGGEERNSNKSHKLVISSVSFGLLFVIIISNYIYH